jgi:hypothetical protein
MSHTKLRFRIEVALAALSALLLVVTLIWRDWLEIVFGVDPDRGSGEVEWAIVGLGALGALIFAALARADWKLLRASTDRRATIR